MLLRVSVVTPSLNKSFKFQSDWPYNNSQVYLLNSILEDLTEDEDREFKTKDDGYLFQSSVNYPNNKSLVKQNVYINKNGNISKVEVVDKNDNIQIMMTFDKQEFDTKYGDDYFELSKILKINNKKSESNSSTSNNSSNSQNNNSSSDNANNSTTNNNSVTDDNTNNNTNNNSNTTTGETTTTSSIDDVIYPMYLPDNTYLTSQEKLDTKTGERLILTFGGDSSFILVEETATYDEDGLIIPVTGEFDFLSDVIGAIGTNSLTWHSNGIEYYMTSDSIATAELVEIARSISVLPVSK